MMIYPPQPRKWYSFMLDIAWPELMIIGIVAVVAIGPKDLPKVMNTMGRWVGKARHYAENIQHSMDQLTIEAEAAERVQKDAVHRAKHHGTHHHSTTPAAAPPESEKPHDHLGST